MSASGLSFAFAVAAGVLDVAANLASTKSNGFARRGWGAVSIILVLAAFALLAEAIKEMDLAVAYAVLGATGIFGTAICGLLFFRQRLKPVGWIGLALIFGAVLVLHTA